MLYKASALQEAVTRMKTDYQFAGLYDLRLKLSQKESLVHINEYLYSEIENDTRKSGEKIFNYVDPKNRGVQIDLEQLATSMVDSDEIEIRATVSLNLLVMSCQETMVIDKVEEQPLDEEKVRAMPGITVYVVKPEDSLWDIAKKFYTTVEEISTVNELKDGEISVGQPLLLIKKVEQ